MANHRSGFAPTALVMALVIAIVLVATGIASYVNTGREIMLLGGALALVMVLLALWLSAQVARELSQGSQQLKEFSTLVNDRMEQFSVMLNLISEQQLISERTKSMAFRDKDREALNRAIREEMARGEFDAALVLVNDMDASFGHKLEADQIRAEIAEMRESAIRRSINDTINQIERDCSAEKWDQALEIAEKAAADYPGHEQATELPAQVRQRKETIKQQLLQRWREAVARKDADGSVDVLRALDIYVSNQEVAQLKEGALELFRARIEQLRGQFTDHIHDKRWHEALQVGGIILDEFPTSKLAQEVREMHGMLRSRAEGSLSSAAS